MRLEIPRAKRVSDSLFVIVLSLILLSLAGQYSKYSWGHPQLKGFVPIFYLDYESTVPTWYSAAALGLAGSLLALIAVAKYRARPTSLSLGDVVWTALFSFRRRNCDISRTAD